MLGNVTVCVGVWVCGCVGVWDCGIVGVGDIGRDKEKDHISKARRKGGQKGI